MARPDFVMVTVHDVPLQAGIRSAHKREGYPEGNAFSTGSEGYFATAAPVIAGEKYQLSLSLVRHGSKPGTNVNNGGKANGPATRTRS